MGITKPALGNRGPSPDPRDAPAASANPLPGSHPQASAPTPVNPPGNSTGGSAGTHEGHAASVPPQDQFGEGNPAGSLGQTAGNKAGQLYDQEHDLRKSAPDMAPGASTSNSFSPSWPATQGSANNGNR